MDAQKIKELADKISYAEAFKEPQIEIDISYKDNDRWYRIPIEDVLKGLSLDVAEFNTEKGIISRKLDEIIRSKQKELLSLIKHIVANNLEDVLGDG